jgi:hypothetical protein
MADRIRSSVIPSAGGRRGIWKTLVRERSRMSSDGPNEIVRLFLQGHSIPDVCNMSNLSIDVVEDAIRDALKEARFWKRAYKRDIKESQHE